ncbi:MAG: class I SAM-dependent methyltransferase, partial [Deltaproteobacteria bacterium]|nr:class I SAM-dependent methyltransferase [Deltaproteobacteria bacterium]
MTLSFNAIAQTFDEDPRRVTMAAAIARIMLTTLPLTSQTSLLDYGAGTGLVSLALAPYVGTLIAADESEGMLEVLRAKLATSNFANIQIRPWNVNQDAADLPVVDVIAGSMVLHHMED